MWNAEVDESPGGLKIAGRNISNLRYADDITLMAEKASLMAQTVKRLPTMQETQVQSLGWEDPLQKEMATHSSVLALRIPGTGEPDGLPSVGSHRVGYDWSDLAVEVKYAEWQYTALRYSFFYLNQSIVSCPVLNVASCPAYRFLRRLVVRCSHLFKNFLVCCDPHTQRF